MERKSLEDLTGFEMLEMKKVLGTSLANADEMHATYALAYVFKKREDKAYKMNDALALTIKEVTDYLGLEDEDESPENPFEAAENDPKG